MSILNAVWDILIFGTWYYQTIWQEMWNESLILTVCIMQNTFLIKTILKERLKCKLFKNRCQKGI